MDARKLEAARALEQLGRVDAAVKAYVEIGAVEEAARLLAARQRFGDAGKLLLGSLGVAAREAGRLDTVLRGRALRAAILLAKGGDAPAAADLFLALEDTGGAVQAYLQARKYAEAAGLSRRLAKFDQAAGIYAQGGLHYEAGICFMEADDAKRALSQFLRVPPDHPKYRMACVKAVQLASNLDVLSFELERFLTGFIETGPNGEAELGAFYQLGKLYRDQGHTGNAADTLKKIVAVDPGYRDANALLAALEGSVPPESAGFEALPDLPDLPELPDPAELRKAKAAPPPSATEGPAFVVGATIADRYRLEERIGAGGMAVVFRATDLDLGDEVALKVFTQAVRDEAAEERFKREIKLSRQLADPHIVRLFDIGSHRGFRYISMELLTGRDLRERMSSPLSFAEALDYLIQACQGLQAAHDAGVVHRDFKPENCFLTTSGLLKVLDFGIAKVQSAPGLTTTGIIAGTPAYISPEQINSFSGVTPATDLYALGVVAYEMFCGRVPFSHDEAMAVLMMQLNDTPVPPRTHNPGIPEELEQVILKLLAKDPAQRLSSCRELAGRLDGIRRGLIG